MNLYIDQTQAIKKKFNWLFHEWMAIEFGISIIVQTKSNQRCNGTSEYSWKKNAKKKEKENWLR